MRRRRPQRRPSGPKPRPSSKASDTQEKRPRDLAVLRRANFSIQKAGNKYTLSATDVNEAVLEQIKAFLRRKTGTPYINGQKMSKPAALRYISANLRKKAVVIMFRRR